ncbi:MAG: DegT/DnrJ/EryC1/StrS family aminotransferase [Magnetococcales bacterium]|nr:DegT/DnrJ/EryC1/StrS family aminotransferase [Magnetococcales bacterium]
MADLSVELLQMLQGEFDARRRTEAANRPEGWISVGWPAYDIGEVKAGLQCLLDLRLTQGYHTKTFEKSYASHLGMHTSVALNSGSSANFLALASLLESGEVKSGDEVICPAATFATVSSPIYQLGLVPVYVDCDTRTWCIDPNEAESAIGARTRVVMPVHNLGFPADMPALSSLCKHRGMVLLEDCCEAHGSQSQGRNVGTYGQLSTLSFHVAHNITTGEGGMVFAESEERAVVLRSLREFGRWMGSGDRYLSVGNLVDYDVRYLFTRLGFNMRMTDITAAIGLVQLGKLDALNEVRRANAAQLDAILSPFAQWVYPWQPLPGDLCGYYGYPIMVQKDAPFSRRSLCEFLEKHNIETRPMMGGCLPDQPGYVGLHHRIHGDLPVSKLIRDHCFFIGCHPSVGMQGLNHIAEIFSAFMRNF